MFELRRYMSKRVCFLLFNCVSVLYLLVTDSLQWDFITIFSCSFALLLMNGIAWISVRKYKDWK